MAKAMAKASKATGHAVAPVGHSGNGWPTTVPKASATEGACGIYRIEREERGARSEERGSPGCGPCATYLDDYFQYFTVDHCTVCSVAT